MFLLTIKGSWRILITDTPAIIFLIVLLRQSLAMEEIEDIEVNRYSPLIDKKKWFEDWDQEMEGLA